MRQFENKKKIMKKLLAFSLQRKNDTDDIIK